MAETRKNKKKRRKKSTKDTRQTKNQKNFLGHRKIEKVEIPLTGNTYAAAGEQIDEVDLSDLVDLSDIADMEKFAREIHSHDLPDPVDSDAVEMSKYTSDSEIKEDLSNRQQLTAGTDQLMDQLSEHTSETPDLTGEDVDADWEGDGQSGEESVGGTVATPEQNVVDNLGKAVGVNFNDFEPLEDKLSERDVHRWELDPASADPDDEEVNREGEEDLDEDTAEKKYNDLMNDRLDDKN